MQIFTRTASNDLSQGPLIAEFAFGEACKLVTVYVHFSTPVTEEVKIELASPGGSLFDTVIDKYTMNATSDYVFAASGAIALNEVDLIRVSITNANAIGSAYVTIKAEK